MGKNSEILPGILYFSFLDDHRPKTNDCQSKAGDNQIKEATDANRPFKVQRQDKPEEIVELELHIHYIFPEIRSSNCKNLQLFGAAIYQGGIYRVEVMISQDNPHADYIKLYLDQPL